VSHFVVYLHRHCSYRCLLFIFTFASSLCPIGLFIMSSSSSSSSSNLIISSPDCPSVGAELVVVSSSPKRKLRDEVSNMPPSKRCKCSELCQPNHICTYGNYAIALEQVSNFIHGELKCKERDIEVLVEKLDRMKSMYSDSLQRGIMLEERLSRWQRRVDEVMDIMHTLQQHADRRKVSAARDASSSKRRSS